MWKTLMGSAFNMLTQNYLLDKSNNYLDEQWRMQQKDVANRLNQATSLFNRNYYRNYLDMPSSRNMLKRVQEQLKEQNRALRNTSVITGATPQVVAASQAANNKLLDSVVGTLSSADAESKERQLAGYENTRNKLYDYLNGGMVNYYNQKMKLQGDRYAGLNSFLQPLVERLPGVYEGNSMNNQ